MYSRKNSQLIHTSTGVKDSRQHTHANSPVNSHQRTNKNLRKLHAKFQWIYTSTVKLDKRVFQI